MAVLVAVVSVVVLFGSPADAATAGVKCAKTGAVAKDSRGRRLVCTRTSSGRKWVRKAVPASSPSRSCDPNYSGCVPIASDVDCAGGSGNGPAFVQGPVRVIGHDIYGLDRDGDGIGCE
jgi:hypothetical protein